MKIYISLVLASVALLLVSSFQNCSGFSSMGIHNLSSVKNLDAATVCANGKVLFNGACRNTSYVSINNASTSTNLFPNFQRWSYSVPIQGSKNLVSVKGLVAIDTSAPNFTEALYTLGYSPSGVCPSQGYESSDYNDIFSQMPGYVFINQYIVKAQGGHVEIPVDYTLQYPIAVSGCFFVVLDGSAGSANTWDTMTANVTFGLVDGTPIASNQMQGLVNYEHFASPTATFSSTNQYLEVNTISTPIHATSIIGSISNGAFDFFNLKAPTGAWNTENTLYLIRGCGAYTAGTFQDQDFYSQVPKNAIVLYDRVMSTSGRSVVQQALSVPIDIDIHAGDCVVQIIAGDANGALDFESAISFNGALGSARPVIGIIDGVSASGVSGWACQKGLASSINVDLYLGGQNVGSYPANQASEPAVAAACASSGAAYRYSIPWTADLLAHAGQFITVYGTSSNAANNNALSGSGTYVVPSAATAAAAAAETTQAADPSSTAAAQADSSGASAAAAAQAAADQAAAAAAAQAAADQAAAAAAAQVAADAAAFAARTKAVIYSYVNAKSMHIFARANVAVPAGFNVEGPAFSVYSAEYASTTPIYKCTNADHQMLSTDPGCEGLTNAGKMGWISTVHVQGSSKLYRLQREGDYIESLNQDALNAGYALDGPMGFAP